MMRIDTLIECSLCGMRFSDRSKTMLEAIKEIHERWHTNCKKEKRNTTEGKVRWINTKVTFCKVCKFEFKNPNDFCECELKDIQRSKEYEKQFEPEGEIHNDR